eukprot:5743167-Pyramimonas_sp.AAC.1
MCIQVQPVLQAAYLGVDQGLGKRLARATRGQKVVKGNSQSHALRGFARATRRYLVTKKVELGGPQAASTYGMQIYGVFGTQLLTLRRRLGAVPGAAKKG